MKTIRRSKQFKKDYKRLQKAGKPLFKLKFVIECLANLEPLAESFRDHALTGNYQGCRECHIEPDWLLIYEIDETELALIRTGSHSELF